jgi:hypothetical protein
MNKKVTVEITYDTDKATKNGVFNVLSELDFIVDYKEIKKP